MQSKTKHLRKYDENIERHSQSPCFDERVPVSYGTGCNHYEKDVTIQDEDRTVMPREDMHQTWTHYEKNTTIKENHDNLRLQASNLGISRSRIFVGKAVPQQNSLVVQDETDAEVQG
ncbi:unnamed protein product [Acanthoscelides obtectus]|uniref:Uncharacterized protein n=1 Tax=Acanthoscelides obtectus TaxID=200917 RepID=A0A9P0MC36_ACAOB|nr:unnamed protein product [Acanthoscelides obtectus]CAK1676569.1 hypothetical protein AOBTE_LOCUS30825 [Acanthoscelides obtectus]